MGAAGKKEAQEKARQEREKRMADAELLAEKREERAQTAGAAASTDAGAAPGAGTGVGVAAGAVSGVVNPPPGALPHPYTRRYGLTTRSRSVSRQQLGVGGAYLRALEARWHLESVSCFDSLDRGSSSAGGPPEAGTPAIGLSTLSQGSVAASISTLTVSTKQSPKQRGDIDPMYPGPAPPPGHGKVGDMGELFQTAPPPTPISVIRRSPAPPPQPRLSVSPFLSAAPPFHD